VRCSKPRCSGLRSLARHVDKRLSANALFLSIANLPSMSAAAACPSLTLSLSLSLHTQKATGRPRVAPVEWRCASWGPAWAPSG